GPESVPRGLQDEVDVTSPAWIAIRTRTDTPSGHRSTARTRCASTAVATALLGEPKRNTQPSPAEQLEETLACLTLKRRRFVKHVLARGSTLASAVREAGDNVSTLRSATEVGRELLRDPRVAFCVQAITEAEGLSGVKLRAVLGHHLAGYDSPDGGDRD